MQQKVKYFNKFHNNKNESVVSFFSTVYCIPIDERDHASKLLKF